MLKYAKLIKHPVPPVKPEYARIAEQEAQKHNGWLAYLYHAEIIDGVLALTLYQWEEKRGEKRKKRELTADMRHFFDGERWAMQRISDNKKLTSSLPHYSYWGLRISLDGADEVISSYFGDSEGKGIRLVFDKENALLDKELEARHKKVLDIIDARMEPIAEKPPSEFYDWIDNRVLAGARYFFYDYCKGKEQTGYCSHCKKEFSAPAKNGSKITCPSCGSELVCKSYGKTTNYGIVNRYNVAYIEQVADNGKPALVERCYHIRQEITGAKRGAAQMKKSISISEYGRLFYSADSIMPLRDKLCDYIYNYGVYKQRGSSRWCDDGSVYIDNVFVFPDNLNEIVQRCNISELRNMEVSVVAPHLQGDLYWLVHRLKEMPFLENLAKQGAHRLLRAISKNHYELQMFISKQHTACEKALNIDKDTFRRFAEMDISGEGYLLYMYTRKYTSLTMPVFIRLLQLGLEANRASVGMLLRNYRISAERFAGYIEKQVKALKRNGNEVFTLYSDYLSMAKDLRLPKTESVLFSKNVQQEHDRLVKIKTDRKYGKQNKLLKKRVKILETLDFSDDNFLIRPLRSVDEFLNESSVLNHCVKTYIDRCARGETNIYGIRKVSDPETPYFTLTLTNEAKVTVNLGKNNCQPPKEVKDFVAKWQRKVINKKKQEFIEAVNPPKDKKEVRITA